MLFAFLMLLQASPVPAPNDATGRLFDCMYGNADKFEPSNESPQNIAIAVISACSSEIDAEVRYATLQQQGGRQTVENLVRDYVITRVVRVRAARNTSAPSVKP